MDSNSVILLFFLIVLVLLSAFFSSAETSLISVNHVKLKTMLDSGNKKAITLQKILSNHAKMLSAILIGNNISNLSASAITTYLANKIFGSVAISIATGILTFVILIFGEIVPKTIATLYSDSIALSYASAVRFFIFILTPLIFVVGKFSDLILFVFHIDKNKSIVTFTENEIKTIVAASHEDGEIESEEREMIYNVFDFSDSFAKDIMIPRIDMTAINVEATYTELVSIFKSSMYTRLPVYENSPDNVIGIINIKDILFVQPNTELKIRDILREAYYTYEFKKTDDLLLEMRENAASMAMVLNEYGATEGLITIEDLLEEIVGEIRDEYDEDEKEFIKLISDNTYLVDGAMKLDDINDAIHTSFFSEDYDSIGGLVIEFLDHIPTINETVTLPDNTIIKVEKMKQNRIEKVILTLPSISALETVFS